MTKTETLTSGQKTMHRYVTYGLMGGFFFGLVVGVVASGPHFREWSAVHSLAVIFGSGLGGLIIGYVLPGLAVGFTAGGSVDPNTNTSATDSGSGSHGSGDCGGDGDGGSCVS